MSSLLNGNEDEIFCHLFAMKLFDMTYVLARLLAMIQSWEISQVKKFAIGLTSREGLNVLTVRVRKFRGIPFLSSSQK